MSSQLNICGIFYAEQKGEESKYGNLRGKSSDSSFQEIYWKNLIVMYASARKTNPDAKMVLFTNINPPNRIMENTLSKLDVSIVTLEYKSRPKKNNWGFWQSTFYIIDALEYLKDSMDHEDTIIFLDIDCIVVRPLRDVVRKLKNDGFLNYEMDYDENYKVHGLNRLDLKAMVEKNTENHVALIPKYFGGEIYGVHGKPNAEKLYGQLKEALKISQTSEDLSFHTEEHLFNYIFAILGNTAGNANGFIKRIWTAHNYRNVEPSDMDLTIWHLPSEKKSGMIKVYEDVIKVDSQFWTLEEGQWILYLGNKVTIPKRKVGRLINDFFKNRIKASLKILRVSQ